MLPVEPAFDQERPPWSVTARTQDELPTSATGGELDLDLLPGDISRREKGGGEVERRLSPELS